MGILIPLPIALAMARRCRRSMAETLPVVHILMIFCLFFSGILGSFLPGLWLLCAGSGLCLLYLARVLLREKKAPAEGAGADLALYFLYAAIFMAFSYGRSINDSDEFAHWALAIKDYYQYHRFSNVFPATDVAWSYPPFTTLWEYFYTRTWITFSEGFSYLGLQMLMMSLMLPGLCGGKRKSGDSPLRTAVFVLGSLLLPLMSYADGFTTLLPDTFAGILSAYIFWMFYRAETDASPRFYEAGAMLGTAALAVSKNNGAVLCAALVGVLLCARAWRCMERAGTFSEYLRRTSGYPAAFSIGYYSWRCYLYCSNGQGSVLQGLFRYTGRVLLVILIFEVLSWLLIRLLYRCRGNWRRLAALGAAGALSYPAVLLLAVRHYQMPTHYAGAVVSMFLKHLFLTERNSIGNLLPVSLSAFLILSALGIAAFFAVQKWLEAAKRTAKRDEERAGIEEAETEKSDAEAKRLFFLAYPMIGLYLAVLLIMYIISIGPANGMSIWLPSFHRYLVPCMTMLMLLGLYLVLDRYRGGRRGFYALLAAMIVLCSDPGAVVSLVLDREPETVYWAIPHSGIALSFEDRFYLIDQDWDDPDQGRRFHYFAWPGQGIFTPEGRLREAGAEDGAEITVSALRRDILAQDCNYVYINELEDIEEVRRRYGELFAAPEEIGVCTLFRVRQEDGGVILERIGQ